MMNIHPVSISFILVALLVFQFEILNKDDNNEHAASIQFILVTLLVFHIETSSNDDNDEQ